MDGAGVRNPAAGGAWIQIVAVLLSFAVCPPAGAQTTAGAPACGVRVSVLQSYNPLRPAVAAAERLNARTSAGSDTRNELVSLDRALADALAAVPATDEAAFALTDVERIVDAMERCADAAGLARDKIEQSAEQLAAAYSRNATTMLRADFAERLLRSPRAQAVLQKEDHAEVIGAAKSIKLANDEARRLERIAQANAAAERLRVAEEHDRQVRLAAMAKLQAVEDVWLRNASAPASGACTNTVTSSFAGKPRDAGWLTLLAKEIGQCRRISDRRDGTFYMGLAMGTSVTDEQLVHASGRALFCFSDTEGKRLFDGANRALDQIYASGGFGSSGVRAVPSWNERFVGTRRLVQIRCDISLSIFGIDLSALQQSLGAAFKADATSFVEYELREGRLMAIKTHLVLSNEVKTESSGNSTTHICDASEGQADSVAAGMRSSGWRQLARVPWRYSMQNDAVTGMFVGPESWQQGNWFTFLRGGVSVDLYNTRYRSPALGANGNCNGGAVDEFAMLASARAARVKPGNAVSW